MAWRRGLDSRATPCLAFAHSPSIEYRGNDWGVAKGDITQEANSQPRNVKQHLYLCVTGLRRLCPLFHPYMEHPSITLIRNVKTTLRLSGMRFYQKGYKCSYHL